jgi:hypothetical protein
MNLKVTSRTPVFPQLCVSPARLILAVVADCHMATGRSQSISQMVQKPTANRYFIQERSAIPDNHF